MKKVQILHGELKDNFNPELLETQWLIYSPIVDEWYQPEHWHAFEDGNGYIGMLSGFMLFEISNKGVRLYTGEPITVGYFHHKPNQLQMILQITENCEIIKRFSSEIKIKKATITNLEFKTMAEKFIQIIEEMFEGIKKDFINGLSRQAQVELAEKEASDDYDLPF